MRTDVPYGLLELASSMLQSSIIKRPSLAEIMQHDTFRSIKWKEIGALTERIPKSDLVTLVKPSTENLAEPPKPKVTNI